MDLVVLEVCFRLRPRCLTWSRSVDEGLGGALRLEVPDTSVGELGMELWEDIVGGRRRGNARRMAVSKRMWRVTL